MALTLRIENSDATTTFDLTAVVKRGSHQQQRAGNKVIETWSLLKKGTAAQVRTAVNSLIDLLEQAVEWHDNTTKDDSVWLREATDGETAKRALIYNYELLPVDAGSKSPYLINPGTEWQLAITRAAEWEATTASSGSGVSLDCLGGTVDLTATITGGTLNGRISRLRVYPGISGGASIERCWVGIRPVNNGVTTFEPVWECEDRSNDSVDVDTLVDANASGGNVARIRFSDGGGVDAMTKRLTITIYDVLGSHSVDDFVGEYLVLMRYQVTTSGTEIGVRMSYGGATEADSVVTQNDIQYLDYTSGSYRLIPLGQFQIGGRGGLIGVTSLSSTAIHLYAERIAGTGFLYADCFVLIPSPHSVYLDGMHLTTDVANETSVFVHEDNKIETVSLYTGSGPVLARPPLSPDGWEYPKDGGLVVFAGERSASQLLTDQLDGLNFSVYKRWKSYHG